MPVKNFEKYFIAHQYMYKIFHGPNKNPPALPPPPPPPPTYLMYSPLHLTLKQKDKNNVNIEHIYWLNLIKYLSKHPDFIRKLITSLIMS